MAPVLDCGRRPAKAVVGETFEVSATVFREGHEVPGAGVVLRGPDGRRLPLARMRETLPGLDRYAAEVTPDAEGRWRFHVEAWGDPIGHWRHDAGIKIPRGQDVELMLAEGAILFDRAARSPLRPVPHRLALAAVAARLCDPGLAPWDRLAAADDEEATAILDAAPLREMLTRSAAYPLVVHRTRALYGAWYEFFPRSEGVQVDPMGRREPRGGTLRTAMCRLDGIARMGFDVVYLPPVHPIGTTARKGRNNALHAGPGDPGSPWAIGSPDGGHDAIHPELGTFADFDAFVARTRELGMEVALDLALQTSPDHPWVAEHPHWFTQRADGSIAYAENPPKKYQDIYPINFATEAWPALWDALLGVVRFWIEQGVRTFRVDNPHTKPLDFWAWLIRQVQDRDPDVIFLSEAFTRPKVMRALAKAGFTQSYTYFTWRNFKEELTEYLEELTRSEMVEYFRGNFFVNTPDILPEVLQRGGTPAFRMRATLAATLSTVWGIYSGFELGESAALPGSEEYQGSEKYEIRVRDWDAPGHLKDHIARLNVIRRENRALHAMRDLRFYPSSSPHVLFYGKMTPERDNVILVAVNLDPFATHESTLEIPLEEIGIAADETYELHELLADQRRLIRGGRHTVSLDPRTASAHVYRLGRWRRRERDFDYYA